MEFSNIQDLVYLGIQFNIIQLPNKTTVSTPYISFQPTDRRLPLKRQKRRIL